MSRQQQGFTMIELIMVIVILGILSAVALPRFYNVQVDARMSKMQALAGTLKSASAIAHSAALLGGQTGATGSVTLEGQSVTLVNGYPDVVAGASANTSGIVVAAGGLSDYDITTTAATATELTVQVDTAHTACKVTYTEAGTGSVPAIDSTGVTTANCT